MLAIMMSRFAGIFATEASRRVAGCSTVASCSRERSGSDGVTGLTAIAQAPTSAMPAVIYGRGDAALAWGAAAHSIPCCAAGTRPPITFPCRPMCGSLPLKAVVYTMRSEPIPRAATLPYEMRVVAKSQKNFYGCEIESHRQTPQIHPRLVSSDDDVNKQYKTHR